MRHVSLFLISAIVALTLTHANAQEAEAEVPDSAAIEAHIKKLGDADFAVREAAEKALLAAGKNSAAALKAALQSTDPEVVQRSRKLLEKIFPPLVMSVEPDGDARVGQPMKFKIRIKNTSDKEVAVVRCLDGSTDKSRYPHFGRSLSETRQEDAQLGKRFCGNCNVLRADDFVKLKPGEEFDPFGQYGHGQGGFGAELCKFTPQATGKITVTFTCDYTQSDCLQWDGGLEREVQKLSAEERALFAGVPKIQLQAQVELTVKE